MDEPEGDRTYTSMRVAVGAGSQRQRARFVLAMLASLALLLVVRPYWGAIFWSLSLAIVFAPLHARILRLVAGRRVVAGVTTLLVLVLGLGVPAAMLVSALVRQATALYREIATQRIDVAAYVDRVVGALPSWLHQALDDSGFGNLASIRDKLAASALEASQFLATHVLGIGLNVFSFALGLAIMLYLLYVLLSDRDALTAWLQRLSPLPLDETRRLMTTFAGVVRATLKGGVVMAATQGLLGGLVLAALGIDATLFWGVVFGVLSMIPAVGAGLLWAPMALYFFVTGVLWKGIVLVVFGTVVLTMVDNILRPLLVGRETRLPASLILVTTLGAIATLGVNGIILGPVVAAMFVASWHLYDAWPAPGEADRARL